MRTAVVTALLALSSAAVAAPFEKSGITDWTKPPAAAAEPKFVPPVAKRMKLANGMAVLVIENHKLPIVALRLLVPNAGAAQDPKGKAGLAAFTADLLDEGAGGLTALGISDAEDTLGASVRTIASTDAAGIAVAGLTKNLDATIDLFGKIAMQPTFDATEFERVKGDRSTSLALRSDRPREVAQIVLNAALFGATSAYGHPTSGQRDDVKSITVADAQAFYQAHYNPAAMTLIVAGDVDPATLKAKLAAFGAWKPTGKKIPRASAAAEKITHRLLLVDRPGAAQSDVRIGLVAPPRSDKRFYVIEVLDSALGGGFTSRLVQRLREQMGITYGIGANTDYYVETGAFDISSAIVTKDTGAGLAEVVKIVDDLAATDVPADELEKSKQGLIRALPAQFETNAGAAAAFSDLVQHGLPDDWYAHYADNVRKVTAKDVRAAAKAVIPSGKLVVVVVGDMSKVRADLDKLNLGEPGMHDLFGAPISAGK